MTSSGQFVIAWDFAKVKKGYISQYEIKKYEDHVVQDSFKFGDDKQIVSLVYEGSCIVFLPSYSIGRCLEQQRFGCEQEESKETHSLLPVCESST